MHFKENQALLGLNQKVESSLLLTMDLFPFSGIKDLGACMKTELAVPRSVFMSRTNHL